MASAGRHHAQPEMERLGRAAPQPLAARQRPHRRQPRHGLCPELHNTLAGAEPCPHATRHGLPQLGPGRGVGGGAFTIVTSTSTSYTPVLGDAQCLIRIDNASAISFNVPTNASVAYPTGSWMLIEQQGAGTITVSPNGGVTVNNTARKTPMQNTTIMLYKVGTDVWNVTGGTI